MTTSPTRTTSRRTLAVTLLLAGLLGAATALLTPPAPAEAQTGTAVMRPSQLTAAQLTAWFRSSSSRVASYRATVPIGDLTRYYLEEGRDEGVAGDLAFAQAVLETGSFSWPGHGQVRANQNNFAGIGACDGGTCTVATFRSARIGVRAQIQHLRAYADPTVTVAKLAHPLESPRFHLVSPKGKAPTWERMGNGNWATDPNYSTKVLNLYASMRSHAGVSGTVRAAEAHVGSFRDVPLSHPHASGIASLATRGIARGCTPSAFCPGEAVTRAQVASLVARAGAVPAGATGAFRDVTGTHQPAVDALAAAGVARGCAPRLYCPNQDVTRAQVASFLQRALRLPDAPAPFRDVPASSTHAGAIGALAARGIVVGSDGRFGPNAPVTRGQVATMVARAYPG